METCPQCQNPLRPLSGSAGFSCPHCAMSNLLGGDDPPEFQNPTDYEIEEEIGRGGDGIVYRCRDKNVGRQVAIKFVNFLRGSDETARQRFRSEIETIASLDHPHIIPVYTNGEMSGRSFYTMKYLSGGNLSSCLGNPLPPGEAVPLMGKIVSAVQHAHERNVLHRDLKPSNVLLDERGEPCLSDFGLAKRHTAESQITLTGSVIGTPSYMSPEQARGENATLSPASDIFSLGTLFYFILTGKHAFAGDDSHLILHKVIEDEPDFPDLDRELIAVCRKCLEKEPARRYQSAGALLEDLIRWQNDEPVTARHLTMTRRARRLVRRQAAPILITILAIILAAVWLRPEQPAPLPSKTVIESEADYLSRLDQSLVNLQRLNYREANRLLDHAGLNHRGLEWRVAKALARGDELWRVDHSEKNPTNLFHARNKIFLTTGSGETFEVSPEDGTLRSAEHQQVPDSLRSLDGTWTARFSDEQVSVLRRNDHRPTYQFTNLPHPVTKVCFSTDSRYLVIQSQADHPAFQVRDLLSGKIVINQGVSASAQVTPNFDSPAMTVFGEFPFLISWNYTAEKTIRQFGLFPDKPLFRRDTYRDDGAYLLGDFSATSHLVSLPDGTGFLSLHPDGTLRRWPPLRELPGLDDSLAVDVGEGPAAVSHNGRFVFFRNFHQQPELHDFQSKQSYPITFSQSPLVVLNDGTFITVVEVTGQLICRRFNGGADALWLWNADTALPGNFDQRVIGTEVTPDEHFAVALFPTGFLKIDLRRKEARFTPTPEIASSISISPDGSAVAVSTDDTVLYRNDEEIALPSGKSNHRISHFRRNDELLIADNTGTLRTYRLDDLANPSSRNLDRITALTSSRDGQYLLTGENEKFIIWENGQKRLEVPTDSSPSWLQLCDDDHILIHVNQMGTIERLLLTTP